MNKLKRAFAAVSAFAVMLTAAIIPQTYAGADTGNDIVINYDDFARFDDDSSVVEGKAVIAIYFPTEEERLPAEELCTKENLVLKFGANGMDSGAAIKSAIVHVTECAPISYFPSSEVPVINGQNTVTIPLDTPAMGDPPASPTDLESIVAGKK